MTSSASTFAADYFTVRDLGRVAYGPALAQQRRLNQAVIDGEAAPTLLLVEHEPVITISQRQAARQHLLASEQQLHQLGIEIHETDRGGDITYHGPGQLVAYPILRLNPLGLNLSRYMRLLEQVVIDLLAQWQIIGQRIDGATGVWVPDGVQGSGRSNQEPGLSDREGDSRHAEAESNPKSEMRNPRSSPPSPNLHAPTPKAKICAMGVRVRKNTTMHGLALNVNPDLTHFDTIVPCGLTGSAVTSLNQQLGENCPTMPQVKYALVHQLDQACTQRQ